MRGGSVSHDVAEQRLGKGTTDEQLRLQIFANPAMLTRGVLAVVFGLVMLLGPGLGLGELVALFASYAVVDGMVAVGWGVLASPRQREGWPVAVDGFLRLGLGVAALPRWPCSANSKRMTRHPLRSLPRRQRSPPPRRRPNSRTL